jgi:hypothetical protein
LAAAAAAIEGLAQLIPEDARNSADQPGLSPARLPAFGDEEQQLDSAVAVISTMLGQLARLRALGTELSHPPALP